MATMLTVDQMADLAANSIGFENFPGFLSSIPTNDVKYVTWNGRTISVFHSDRAGAQGYWWFYDVTGEATGLLGTIWNPIYHAYSFTADVAFGIVDAARRAINGAVEMGASIDDAMAAITSDIGNIVAGTIKPVVDVATVPLVIVGIIALVYLFKGKLA